MSDPVLAAAVGALATLLGVLLSNRMHRRRDLQTRLYDRRREFYLELLSHFGEVIAQQVRHRSTLDEQLRFTKSNSRSSLLIGQMMLLSSREVYDRAWAVFEDLERLSFAIEFHREALGEHLAVQRQLARLIPAIRRELGVAEGRESWKPPWGPNRFTEPAVEDAPPRGGADNAQ